MKNKHKHAIGEWQMPIITTFIFHSRSGLGFFFANLGKNSEKLLFFYYFRISK